MADPPIRLTVGGDVQANKGTYLKRPADEQLFEACLENKIAYVLACRQIGKSSLKNAVAERLLAEGIRVARVDLNRIGQRAKKAEDWYFNLLDELASTLRLKTDVEAWWESKPRRLTLTQRFLRFLDEVVLTEISEPVVIFIDEIDMMLGLPFTGDFFAAIRAVYNDRAQNPAYQRLTFVLLGVATPDELINDPKRTPFNIGQAILMRDFTQTECAPLRLAIEAKHAGQSDAYFQQIYDWTNGHPYLTQKLCWALVSTPPTDDPDLVNSLVKATFLTGEERDEDHFRVVERRVLNDVYKLQILRTYKQVLQDDTIPDKKVPAVNRLELYGLVITENGRLAVRNQIYRKVFNLAWVTKNIPTNWTRIVTYIAVAVAVLAVGFILYNAWVGIQFQDCYASFYQTKAPVERVAHLARMLRLRGLLGPTDYGYQARELFYGLSREEQLALFSVDNVEDSDLIVVIKGLYITLADIDGTDSTRPLLEAMATALGDLNATEETEKLEGEINGWLEGRKLAKQNQYANALAEYNNAIALNGENPATLYERARVLIELSEYQQALSDLDQVVAIAGRVPAPTPTPSPTNTPAVSSPSTTTLAALSPSPTMSVTLPMLTPTSTSTPSTDMTPSEASPSASVTATSASLTIPTETSMPTPTPTPGAIISEFGTTGQMISAVRNMIYGNPDLVSSLANAPSSAYPNLREFGLVPTPTYTLVPPGEMPLDLTLTLAPISTPNVVKLYWVGVLQKYDDPASNPSRVVVSGTYIYVLDKGTDRVYKHHLNEVGDGLQDLDIDPVLLRRGDQLGDIVVGDLVDMVWMPVGGGRQKSNLLVLESGGSLLEYDPDPVFGLTVLSVGGKDQWRSPQLVGSYFGNLYILDSQLNQLFKYLPTADGGYSNPPEPWFQVPVDLAGVVDMAIDGYIYLLYADGRILKFMDGELVSFELTELDEPLRGPTAIFTSPDEETKFLYVADAGNGRIVQFSKEGQFIRQFRAAEAGVFDQLKSLYVDEIGSRFYILSGNTLYMAIPTLASLPPSLSPTPTNITSILCNPYFDDFSDSNSGWPIQAAGSVQIGYSASGEYFIQRQQAGLHYVEAPANSASQYAVEVDARWDNANIGYEHGLIFGQTSFPGPTYLFGVDPVNQTYRLIYYNGTSWECINQPSPCWVNSPSINLGSTPNHLKVECDGATVSLYVNDQLLWEGNVSYPCSGKAGLFAQSSPATPNAQAYFDNFRVTCPTPVSSTMTTTPEPSATNTSVLSTAIFVPPMAAPVACPNYAISIVEGVGVEGSRLALCAPDGDYASVGLVPDSVLTLDMEAGNQITDGPGVDFYYYERPSEPGILMEQVAVAVAQDDGAGIPGPFTVVFVWGDDDPGNNGAIPEEYLPEVPNRPIDRSDLHNDTGIGINIGSDDGQTYRFIRFQTHPPSATPGEGLLAQVDALERVQHEPIPTDTTAPPSVLPTMIQLTSTPSEPTETFTSEPSMTLIPELSPTPSETPTQEPSLTPKPMTPTPLPLSGQIAFPVYDSMRKTWDIYLANVDGSNRRMLVEEASEPAISPDGSKIAFRSWNDTTRGLMVTNIDGTGHQRISLSLEDASPYWAFGESLVFHSTKEGPTPRLYAAGTWEGANGVNNVQNVMHGTDPAYGQYPAWVPDGHIVHKYFDRIGNYRGLYIMNSDGSNPTPITDHTGDTMPSVSPHSDKVAFMSDRTGKWEVYVVNMDGSGLKQLTQSGGYNSGLPTWSPNGNHIAFVSDRDNQWAIWVINPDGSGEHKLLDLGSPLEWWERISWAP